jgi:hypothetical protein
MTRVFLLDVAPDPAGTGLLAVVFLVIGFIVLLAGALVVFLWYRKRSMRGLEMIRRDVVTTEPARTSNANQP